MAPFWACCFFPDSDCRWRRGPRHDHRLGHALSRPGFWGRIPELATDILNDHRPLVLTGAILVGVFFWPADGIFRGGLRVLLALVMVLSLAGLPSVLPTWRRVLLLGALLGGAYGGLRAALPGAGIGFVLGMRPDRYSPVQMGAFLGLAMAVIFGTPSLSAFGFLPGPSNFERWQAYTEWAMANQTGPPDDPEIYFSDPLDGRRIWLLR